MKEGMAGESDSFDVEGNRLTLLIEPHDRLTGLLTLIESATGLPRLLVPMSAALAAT